MYLKMIVSQFRSHLMLPHRLKDLQWEVASM